MTDPKVMKAKAVVIQNIFKWSKFSDEISVCTCGMLGPEALKLLRWYK